MSRFEEVARSWGKHKEDWWKDPPRANGHGPAGLVCRCASEIAIEPVDWLWTGRFALGKHTCIAGKPGTGKSQLATFIEATVTMGGEWPCNEGRSPQGSVIILSAEDGEADTIVPRLHAAGADCGRVHIVSAVTGIDGKGRRSFNLQADLELLEKKITELGDVVLVRIDPISSYLGKTDSHKNADVRGILQPSWRDGSCNRVAVNSVTHFSKSTAVTAALHRFIGSIAFVGAPRMAFVVTEDPDDDDRRLFLHAKNNLAAPPQGLAYRLQQSIVGTPGQGIVASHVQWEADPVKITANEAIKSEDKGGGKAIDRAVDFLNQALAAAPLDVNQVNKEAESLGISKRTLERARAKLGVTAIRSGRLGQDGCWLLSLPLSPPNYP